MELLPVIGFNGCREFLERKGKKASRFKVICFTLVVNFLLWFFCMGLLFILTASRGSSRTPNRKGFKKVIKEGIFWDSVEWHER